MARKKLVLNIENIDGVSAARRTPIPRSYFPAVDKVLNTGYGVYLRYSFRFFALQFAAGSTKKTFNTMRHINSITFSMALCAIVFSLLSFGSQPAETQYEFTSFTVVESIVPNGLGRSRIISCLEDRDYREFTTERSETNKKRNKSDRGEIRVNNFEETKLLNFFNIAGIRFQNIAANDALVNSKVNDMMSQGWELVTTNAAVESVGGETDTEGIFITRFYFKRTK